MSWLRTRGVGRVPHDKEFVALGGTASPTTKSTSRGLTRLPELPPHSFIRQRGAGRLPHDKEFVARGGTASPTTQSSSRGLTRLPEIYPRSYENAGRDVSP